MIFDFDMFAKNIRLLRKLGDYSQTALAKEAGIGNRITISQIETGYRLASFESAIKLSAVFNMTPQEVVEWDKPKTKTDAENRIKTLENEVVLLKKQCGLSEVNEISKKEET